MRFKTALAFAIAFCGLNSARGQYGPSTRYESYPLDSGPQENSGDEPAVAYRQLLEIPGTPWIWLHFGDCRLGEASYLTLTSLQDGSQQRFDARSWREWRNADALVSGDAVEIELVVAPGESDVSFTIVGITTPDEPGGDPPGTRSLCDDDDSRTPSSDPRVGRLFSVGCTGWLIGNDAVLTAGHCVIGGSLSGVLEFNVPPSSASGNMVPAAAVDRYPVISSSVVFEDGGESHDWAVFQIGPNAVTGLSAHQVQGFFKVTTVVPSNGGTLRVTGYGVDNDPPGSGGSGAACCPTDDSVCTFDCNATSQTQQTSTGPLDDLDGSRIEHKVDTRKGNSGGPIIREGNGFAIGIHTTGGCDQFFSDYDNGGTWFGYAPLFHAVNSFTPSGTIFVDRATPDSVETGTLLFPYDTVVQGFGRVPSGGALRIFAGSYTAATGHAMTFGADGRAMRLEALLGTVVIGN